MHCNYADRPVVVLATMTSRLEVGIFQSGDSTDGGALQLHDVHENQCGQL